MICVFIRNVRGGPTDTDTGECHVNMESEIGVMLPQIKTFLESPEARGHKDGFSHRTFTHLYISYYIIYKTCLSIKINTHTHT